MTENIAQMCKDIADDYYRLSFNNGTKKLLELISILEQNDCSEYLPLLQRIIEQLERKNYLYLADLILYELRPQILNV
jgi:hypothetical protein